MFDKKVRRLTDEEYDGVVDRLADRVVVAVRGSAKEGIKKYMTKKQLEESKWFSDSTKPVVATIAFTLTVDQTIGDALLELEKMKSVG